MNELLAASTVLVLVMDPLGNVPLFLKCLQSVEERRRTYIIFRESLIALGILLFFLLFGPTLLRALGIGITSLQLTGGILLFLIAVSMIFPGSLPTLSGEGPSRGEEPLIVPLATPAIAGPSTIATIMILASKPGRTPGIWCGALVIAWIASTLVLSLAPRLSRWLGARGLAACERLMGIILTVIAVQMFLDGIMGVAALMRTI